MAAGAIRRIVPNDSQDLPAPEEGYGEGRWKGAVRRVSGYTTKRLASHRLRLAVGSMAIQGIPFLSCCCPDRQVMRTYTVIGVWVRYAVW